MNESKGSKKQRTALTFGSPSDEDKRREAVKSIRALAKGVRGMTVQEILEARDEGRR